MIGSTFLLTVIGALVTNWIIEPRLGPYRMQEEPGSAVLGIQEKRGLKAAGITLVFELVILLFMVAPEDALLRDAKGTLEPFFQGMVRLRMAWRQERFQAIATSRG
jgi:aminobenzoyl-glutamate transport protein